MKRHFVTFEQILSHNASVRSSLGSRLVPRLGQTAFQDASAADEDASPFDWLPPPRVPARDKPLRPGKAAPRVRDMGRSIEPRRCPCCAGVSWTDDGLQCCGCLYHQAIPFLSVMAQALPRCVGCGLPLRSCAC